MGESIPLSIFKTNDSGVRMYLDKDCTIEESFDDNDKLKPFYTVSLTDIRYGKTKKIVRYIKNIGGNQCLFAMYQSKKHNIDVVFIGENGEKLPYANGMLAPNMSARIEMDAEVFTEDWKASIDLHLVSREIKI